MRKCPHPKDLKHIHGAQVAYNNFLKSKMRSMDPVREPTVQKWFPVPSESH